MYDARSPGRAFRYLKDRFFSKLKLLKLKKLLPFRELSLKPLKPLKPTPHDAERLEPRIVLTSTPLGTEQIMVVDADVADTLDESGLWQSIDDFQLANAQIDSALSLSAYKSFTLDHNLLATRLAETPVEFSGATGNMVTLPSPGGGFDQFAIWESAIMAPDLAAKFPMIETFAGRGIDDPTASVRMDLTPQGFHAQVLSSQGTYYVDPFSHLEATGPYVSYFKTDALPGADDNFSCLVDTVGMENSFTEDNQGQHSGGCCCPDCAIIVGIAGQESSVRPGGMETSGLSEASGTIRPLLSHGTQLRSYDLAVAATGEYTAYHGGTVTAAMSAIVTTMNRVNGIYETDIATRMILVANNDQLVYTDGSTDPYSNSDGFSMLSENQSNIDSIIGDANYDIGHVFSTGGGGVAGLGVIGDSGSKARGVTGQGSPVGDPFDVDYVAHEMGHQFGANHTFNGNNGNRNASTAMEPGSASTIMGYAGIMGSDNLQSNSDPYFHSVSLDEMVAEITTGNANAAATITNTGNSVPTVDAGSDYTIPAATAFVLTATGSDPDAGDVLTYCWEQRDLGAQQGVNDGDNGSSPLFRSWNPTTSSERVFPRYSDLLSGTTVVGETLPTTSRDMNFRVVLRDNSTGGSAFNTDDMLVTVVDTGSPFQVTTANSAVSWTGGGIETVSWDVAGTDLGAINAATVDILLSTDGGATFSTVAGGVANDGTQNITVPNTPTSQARLKVQAVGNIFFDISNSEFTILAGGPGVSVAESGGNTSVSESGTTDTYEIALQTAPTAAVEITVTADAQSEVSVDGVTFGSTAVFSRTDTTAQTVTIRAIDDSTQEGNHSSTITHAITNTGDATNYPTSMVIGSVTVTVADNDVPGVTLTQTDGGTSVSEDGATDTYSIALDSIPAGTVQITVTSDAQSEVSSDGVNFGSNAVFNFNDTTTQNVTIRAIDDSAEEGNHTSTISHAVTSTADSTNYPLTFSIDDLTVSVIDNDLTALVGIDFDTTGGSAPTNWTQINSFSVPFTQSNLVNEDGTTTTIDVTLTVSNGTGFTAAVVASTLPTHDQSLSGLDGEIYTTSNPLTATFGDLTPGGNYEIYVFGLENYMSYTNNQRVTITGAGTATVFDQTLTAGNMYVNGEQGDSSRTLASFAQTIIADSSGEIEVAVTPNAGTIDLSLGGLAIRPLSGGGLLTLAINDDSVTETGGAAATNATVTRSGSTSGDLTVTLTSDDTTEATVPATVTIPDGQSSVTFDIAAVDDIDVDGTQTVTISASASGLTGASDTLDVTDDDVPLVLTVSIADASVSESAGAAATTATVTRTDTSGDLVVTLLSDDTSEATVPSTVTILDGQSSATFDIAAVDDSTADGTQTVTVAVSASGYASGSDTFDVTDDEASLVTILDDGESGFTQSGFTEQTNAQVSAAYDGDNHNMQGGSGTASWTFSGLDDGEYQVDATWAHKYDNKYNTLDAPFSIANGGGTLLASATVNQSIAPSAFTYGGYNWDALGTVNVTGGSLIVTLGAGSSSSKYTVADAIRIEKLGDVSPTLTVSIADASVSESAGAAATTATVTRTDTSGDLVVTLLSDDTSEATVPSTVTILDGQSSATFDIAAVDDSTADGTQTVTVAVSASGYASGSDTFDVTDDEASLVTILDDGESGFTQSGFTEQTNAQVSAAYDGDNHNMQGGSGTASWTFSGLDDGEYQVAATWAHKYDNKYNTLDAPFSIANGGGTLLASATVNQSIAPSAFTYGGYNWDALGTVNVTGGSLIVTLGAGSSSSKYTVADAIRIEKLGDVSPTLTVSIADASVSESAGAAATTATVTRTDTSGDLVVTLLSDDTSEATVPSTVTILDGQSSATFDIAAVDDSTADGTQTVTVAVSASGYASGSDTFDVTDDEASLVTILDDGESGFTQSGFTEQTNAQVSAAYDGDNHNMQGGSGTASWTFSGLDDGEYQVAATWAHKYDNKYNTLDAPFSIANGGGTLLASATVNQSIAPSAFTYGGYNWDALGTVNVTGGSLIVTLGAGSSSSKYTVADAIRIEKLGDVSPTLTVSIADASVSESAGAAATTATVTRTDTSGDLVVTLLSDDTSEATVPSTVTILDGQSSATFDIAAVDDSTADGTQTVTVAVSASGYASGSDTFDVTDDEASLVTILDDGESGFTQSGFTEQTNAQVSAAYDGDNHNMQGGSGTASWTFSGLDDGEYQVDATWAHKYDNKYNTLDAPFSIANGGGTLLASATVNQSIAPSAFTYGGYNWDALGTVNVTGGSLIVTLGAGSSSSKYTVADAIRIEKLGDVSPTLTVSIADASVSESAGAAATTATVTRTDTSGDLVVTLLSDDTSEATVPSTVTILDGQSSATFDIAAVDDSTADGTQTVTVAVSASGYASGSDTFDVTDDEASLVTILDDGESGFTQSGFTEQTNAQVSAAYDGDNHNMQGGSGTASWTFSGLDDGEYQVAATWAHKYDNQYNTLDAPFSIANGGGTLLASATVNQSIAPSAFTYGGYRWDTLGTVNVTGGSLIVTLGAGSSSSKYTVADAIRIEKTSGGGGGTLGQISGTVWNDVDGDGVYDTSESPLESWFIFLDQNQNGALDSSETAVQTSVDGGYLFEDLPDDTYYVTEILPSGWEQTTPSGGSRNSTVPLGTVQIVDGTSVSTAGNWVAEQSQINFTDISRQSFANNGNRDFSTSSTQSAGLMNADDFRADPLFSGFNGSGFATVIIDSGADLDHPFYGDQLVYSYDFSGADDSDASDFDGHGTNCAGIAVSSDATYTGTAPGSDLIVLKVFTDAGAGSFTDIEEALQWVVSNAATYNIASINMSLGDGGTYNSTQTSQLSDELASLVALDVMVISAAGNEFTTAGTEGISYPAVDPNSLAVSAVWDANNGGPYSWGGGTVDNTTAADRVTSFSSRSSTLTDIFAPGALITNAGLGGGTSSLAGTSQAAPQVAGIATVAQQLATSALGRRLTQAEFRSLMQSTGVTINDGDDENDNVTNTGADYSRIDMWALMKGILATSASGDAVHNTTVSGGGTASGLNFGNRVTGSRLAASMEPAMVASAANTDQQATSNLNNISSFNGEKKTTTDDRQQVASVQPPLTTVENRVDQLFVGNHRLTHLVDTMFSDGTVTSMPLATSNTLGEETGGSSSEIIDNLLAVNTDPIWSGTSGEDILERKDISQQEDEDASLWLPDEPFYEFFA